MRDLVKTRSTLVEAYQRNENNLENEYSKKVTDISLDHYAEIKKVRRAMLGVTGSGAESVAASSEGRAAISSSSSSNSKTSDRLSAAASELAEVSVAESVRTAVRLELGEYFELNLLHGDSIHSHAQSKSFLFRY
jgi:hypothetical protein